MARTQGLSKQDPGGHSPEAITPIHHKLVSTRLQCDVCDLRLRCEQADRLLEVKVTQAPVMDCGGNVMWCRCMSYG
jgi:hypothetical protein